MDWGLGNPNKTAALVAGLMTAVWILAYVRKWGFWVALTLFFGLGVCLILTFSRGGLVGAVAGGLGALAWVPRPYPLPRMIGLAAAGLVLVAFASVVNEPARFEKGLTGDDLSVGNRLLIWKQAPAMIHDAPNGWGIGGSGNAYMQWYQPITRGEGYRTLVNSHLTWLVEFNWWGRIAYIVAWIAAFVLLWPDSRHRWYSIPCATLLTLFVCAAFSSVAESPWVWIMPVLGMVSVLAARTREDSWPRKTAWLIGTGVATTLVVGLLVWQSTASASPIRSPRIGVVTLGATPPTLWLIAPDANVLGEHYGHEARQGFQTDPIYQSAGFGVAAKADGATHYQTLILSGRLPSSPLTTDNLVLLSPQPPASAQVLQWLASTPKVTVVVGEFSPNKDFWSQQSQAHPNLKLQVAEGMEDYISDWSHEIALAAQASNPMAMPVTTK
jgi:hypothetical protein